ncbi:MMPL family transporter [Spirillospora sp. NPDC029432]|uniref:MMPL family transporter n=1 Tax=Spirillospora sp. NPDC029432 TaxID=3154599 RepID=UPI0034568CBF
MLSLRRGRRPGRLLGGFGRLCARHRGPVLGLAAAAALLLGLAANGVSDHLSNGGYTAGGTQSARADRLLSQRFETRPPDLILMVRTGGHVDDDETAERGRRLTRLLAARPGVKSVRSYWSPHSADLRSRDRRSALIAIVLTGDDARATRTAERLVPRAAEMARPFTVQAAGPAWTNVRFIEQGKEDQRRAELIVVPITILILLATFGSVYAAMLPAVVGALGVIATLAAMRLLAKAMSVSVLVPNLATAIGFGLAIDYSLFLVTRYREELARGLTVPAALERAMATAGRTVLFSAVTVTVALSGLLAFPLPALRSLACSAMTVVLMAAAAALLVLPALLALIGTRINHHDVFARLRRHPPRRRPPVLLGGTLILTALLLTPTLTRAARSLLNRTTPPTPARPTPTSPPPARVDRFPLAASRSTRPGRAFPPTPSRPTPTSVPPARGRRFSFARFRSTSPERAFPPTPAGLGPASAPPVRGGRFSFARFPSTRPSRAFASAPAGPAPASAPLARGRRFPFAAFRSAKPDRATPRSRNLAPSIPERSSSGFRFSLSKLRLGGSSGAGRAAAPTRNTQAARGSRWHALDGRSRGRFAVSGAVFGTPLAGLSVRNVLRFRRAAASPYEVDSPVWRRVAEVVTRRPVLLGGGCALVLVLLALPFGHARFGLTDERILPAHVDAHAVADRIGRDFAEPMGRGLTVVLPSTPCRSHLDRYARRLSAQPHVISVKTTSGHYVRERRKGNAPGRYAAKGAVRLHIASDVDPQSAEGKRLVERVRAVHAPGRRHVTGAAAQSLDTLHVMERALPKALAIIGGSTFILLFLFTGGLLVSLKALLLGALSLTASFGAIVWIFQDGHAKDLVGGFTETGRLDAMTLLLAFTIAFGLSIDYEVFLLSRIKELYAATGRHTASIITGIARTGRLVTAAALVVAISMGALVTSSNTVLKMNGLGLALAVLVDATLVRGLLVPAFMQLTGPANWWSPRPLARLHNRSPLAESAGPRLPLHHP